MIGTDRERESGKSVPSIQLDDHTHTHTHIYTYRYTHTCIYINIHTHIYKHIDTHTHTHTYIHTYIYIYIYIYIYDQLIGLVDRVFANGLGDQGLIPGHVIPKTFKIVLDTYLLNTRQYKVHIKGNGAISGKG